MNEFGGTNILITADHGFLYTYSPLTEDDKVGKTSFNDIAFAVDDFDFFMILLWINQDISEEKRKYSNLFFHRLYLCSITGRDTQRDGYAQ